MRGLDRSQPEDAEHREAVLRAGAHRRRRWRGCLEHAVQHRSRASSDEPGSASVPLSSVTSQGRGPTLPYASVSRPSAPHRAGERDRCQVVAAPPGPPDVRRPDRPVDQRQLDRGDELALAQRRDARADEPVVDRDAPRARPVRRRRPRAPYTSSAGAVSAAGDALQMLPARVARFRICTDPTTSAASASAANRVRIVASSAMSVITVPRPDRPAGRPRAGSRARAPVPASRRPPSRHRSSGRGGE